MELQHFYCEMCLAFHTSIGCPSRALYIAATIGHAFGSVYHDSLRNIRL